MEGRRDLSSWKEIADYFGVSVRTVQHWEEERGLPVRRLPGGGRGRVFARISELEEWKRSCVLPPGEAGSGFESADQRDEAQPNGAAQPPGPTATTRPYLTARSVFINALRIALIMDFADRSLVVHVSELVGSTPRLDVHVFFNLGPDLSLRGFDVGDRFESTHEQLYKQGKLDHPFTPAELDTFHNLTYLTRPPSSFPDSAARDTR